MTHFEKVLELTKKIPKGKISTYKELATAIGSPGSARAVGNALNKNKDPIIIPCHRVIRSDGNVGGYSGGQEHKIDLLKTEGIPIKDGKVTDFMKYLHVFRY